MKQLVFFLPFVLVLTTMAQDFSRTEIAGRSVEMKLIKLEDLSPVAWPKVKARLGQTAASFEETNVLLVLKANGIAPDSEALTLVYDLNPSIYDLNSIPPNTQIQIPSIKLGDQKIKDLLQGGYLVQLTVDPEIHQELTARIKMLERVEAQITDTGIDLTTINELKQTIGWFKEIERRFKRRTGPPLRQATLKQLNDEADRLTALAQEVIQEREQLPDRDKQQIAAIFGDTQTVIKEYGQFLAGAIPTGEQLFLVTVSIKGTNAALIAGLRVYYTFNGLFRQLPANPPIKAMGFTQLGSGQSQTLLMKSYQVWAAKDGDPNHPLTPPFSLNIDETSKSPIAIDLSVVTRP